MSQPSHRQNISGTSPFEPMAALLNPKWRVEIEAEAVLP